MVTSFVFCLDSFAKSAVDANLSKKKDVRQIKDSSKKKSKSVSSNLEDLNLVKQETQTEKKEVAIEDEKKVTTKSNKTQGHYLGISFVGTHLKFNERYRDGNTGSSFTNVATSLL